MTELPSGWTRPPFGEVARISAKLVDPADHPGMPHIAPNHIESGTGRLLPYRTVAEDGVTSPKYRFHAGEVLYSKIRPYLAKATLARFDGLCSADMYPLTTDADPRYLAYWLISSTFTALAANEQGRSLLPKINREALFRIPIPLAPLAEQRRIVEAIEEQFSRLDAAEATLTQVIGRLGLYRQSTLDALADGAPSVRMEDVLSQALANGRSVGTRAGGFPVLRLTAVRNGTIDVRESKPGDWTASDAAKHVVHEGDFLIARGNGSLSLVGRGGLVDHEPMHPVAYPDTLIRARVRRNMCEPHFLRLVWDSSGVRQQIEETARTTAGIHKINQKDLAGLLLPLPSVAKQRERTASTERRLSLLDALHEQVEVVRRRAGSLRQSLLASAFSGSLVKRETGL